MFANVGQFHVKNVQLAQSFWLLFIVFLDKIWAEFWAILQNHQVTLVGVQDWMPKPENKKQKFSFYSAVKRIITNPLFRRFKKEKSVFFVANRSLCVCIKCNTWHRNYPQSD
jgi:hypothetical protein